MNCLLTSRFAPRDFLQGKINHFIFDELTFTWRFQHGSIPHDMLGLIPFYAFCFACYAVLTYFWVRRSLQFQGQLLGLQKAVSALVYLEVRRNELRSDEER